MFGNTEEIITEKELRKRTGPKRIWARNTPPDHPLYSKAGFYPVEYAIPDEYQKHNTGNGHIADGILFIPAEDIPITEAMGQAVKEADHLREQKEERGVTVEIGGVIKTFSASANAKALYEAAKNKKDGIARRWITMTGEPVTLTPEQLETVHNAVGAAMDDLYSKKQAEAYDQIVSAATVAELRERMKEIRHTFA